jgi:hypothetical protein
MTDGNAARLAEPEDLDAIRIRRFDGADTWRYLED